MYQQQHPAAAEQPARGLARLGESTPGHVQPDLERLQQKVEAAASFHLLVTPSGGRAAVRARGGVTVGLDAVEMAHRFKLELAPPGRDGVVGTNVVGERLGDITLRWVVVEPGYVACRGHEPAAIPLDPASSQRFVIEEMTFRFASGDGFRCFGSGRTFPMAGARLVTGGIADIVEGSGCFRGRLGNVTLAGEIAPDGGFSGHVMVRVLDPDRTLREAAALPPPEAQGASEPGATYLTWIARKAGGAKEENRFSLTPSGTPRGVNIPVPLSRVWADCAITRGFRVSDLRIGEAIGREIGFGRESRPRTATMGSALTPYQFEGVSLYTFYDPEGANVGTLTANVVEGRSIQVRYPGAPAAPGLRFGYFALIVGGTGCFEGVEGLLYGTAGSVFAPPPAPHVIANLYVARLHDSSGRWRRPALCGAAPSPAPSQAPRSASEWFARHSG